MATNVPYNSGLDWGTVSAVAELPNTSGAVVQASDLRVGARAYVPDDGVYTCTDPTLGAAVWARSGSVVGGGGTGAQIGPFTKSAVGVGAAFTVLGLSGASAWIAPRAGSITAASGCLSVAAADDVIDMAVLVNAAPTLYVSFQAGGAVGYSNTAAPGTHAIAADDVVTIAVIGGAALSNTPDLVAFFEFTAGL